jgi:hypothetical protein
MDFKIGYSVKPKEITTLNEVIFEEFAIGGEIGELVDVQPTADECKAYGFNYVNSRCYVIANSTDFIDELIFLEAGSNNSKGAKSNYTATIGLNNDINYACNNDLVVGSSNSIIDNVSNTIVSGTKGEATASNSIVLGGNAPDDNLAERQTTTLMYGVQTTNGNTKASYLNNITANFFTIPDNTAMYFHADVLAVRVGGTSTGNPGDFLSWVERGVVINKSGVLSIQRERDTIQGSGNHTTWRPTGAVSGTNFVMNVRGAANTIIEWASTIKFTEIRTGVAL